MLDDGGALLVTARARPYRTWASPPGGRRTGAAADSVIATVTLGMVAELPPATSAELAQTAADVTAGLPDSLVCTTDGLAARLAGYRSAALPRPELERLVNGHQLAGRRVIVTSGSFDRLHAGDLEALNQARRLGDVLVVAVHSDTIAPRPLRPARSRAAAVAALSCVDHVTITDNEVLVDLLDRLGPDLYVRP
jgi:cytidyltransferase-like protein